MVAVVWEAEGKLKRENRGQRGDSSEELLETLLYTQTYMHIHT